MRRIAGFLISIFILSTFTPAVLSGAVAANGPVVDASGRIDGIGMRDFIGMLASPEFEGRLTAQPGQMKTAGFIATAFDMFGLTPGGEGGGYYQEFSVPTNIVIGEPEVELIIGDEVISYEIGGQYIFRGYTGSGDVTAPIAFVGYGITDSELGYDDYGSIDVRGKWALCLRGWHPAYPDSSFDWAKTGWKARNAYSRGAVGLILVGVNSNGTGAQPIGSMLYGLPVEEMHPDFPMVHVSLQFTMDLFGHYGWYLPGIVAALQEGTAQPFDLPSEVKAHVKVEARFQPDARTVNVIGYIPGSDPKLSDRAVLICAHHDHVGHQPGILFPGSNDNASGTIALLAIAKAASECGFRPKRSLLFVSFTGEEMGLLGSRHFVEDPTWPLEKIDHVINLDMVGQGNVFALWGGTDFPRSRAVFERIAEDFDIELQNYPAYPVSDHGPFVDAGIEAVMIHGGGEKKYPLAHKPYVYNQDMIDPEILETLTRITFFAAFEFADE